MKREAVALAGTVVLAVSGAVATSVAGSEDSDAGARHHGHPSHGVMQKVALRDVQGDRVGTVWMRQRGHSVVVHARVHSLSAGFHGFHVHTTGLCDPTAPEGPFTTAGGHLAAPGTTHGAHTGDLPSLLANGRGKARLSFTTSRFTVASLRDADGSAVMVHAGQDNYANIPDRYTSSDTTPPAPGPDATTKRTGDAGDRFACGVVPAAG
jgi:Cu-Zn family superoxide dismutase